MAATFDAGAIILAGGASRRMGQDKSLLPFRGVPLIQHIADQLRPSFEEIAIVSSDQAAYAFLGLDVIPDLEPGHGPLMGMASGLKQASHDWNLIVATDIPEIPLTLLDALFGARSGSECVVPREPSGALQPLCALYHRDLTDRILSILSTGEHRVMALMDHCQTVTVPIDTGTLCNLNTLEEYRRAIQ